MAGQPYKSPLYPNGGTPSDEADSPEELAETPGQDETAAPPKTE